MAEFRAWFPGEGETEADGRVVPSNWEPREADLAAEEAVEQFRSGIDYYYLIGDEICVALRCADGELSMWDVSVVASIDYHARQVEEGGARG